MDTQLRITEESDIKNDLIQEGFLDTYNNLTLKSVMMLKWVKNHCVDKGEAFEVIIMQKLRSVLLTICT